MLAKKIRIEIKDPNLKITESNLSKYCFYIDFFYYFPNYDSLSCTRPYTPAIIVGGSLAAAAFSKIELFITRENVKLNIGLLFYLLIYAINK